MAGTMKRTTRKQTSTKHQHLVPKGDGWALRRTGAKRASHVFGKKQDALTQAIKVARNQKTVLVIHGKDGSVKEQRDYTSAA